MVPCSAREPNRGASALRFRALGGRETHRGAAAVGFLPPARCYPRLLLRLSLSRPPSTATHPSVSLALGPSPPPSPCSGCAVELPHHVAPSLHRRHQRLFPSADASLLLKSEPPDLKFS